MPVELIKLQIVEQRAKHENYTDKNKSLNKNKQINKGIRRKRRRR
jgi:hypothetical protein